MTGSRHDRPSRPTAFALTSLVGFLAVVGIGAAFALVLSLVAARWQPLRAADAGAVQALNAIVGGRASVVGVLHAVTALGGSEMTWLVFALTVAWLLIRRAPRLALYVAVTGLGAATLVTGVKALVARARPVVDVPVVTATGASFPSGHTVGATVTYGMLLLVFLPAVPGRWRSRVITGGVAVIGAVGFTRVALGVHFPSDVVGGWLLGALWLAVTALAFRQWRGAGQPAPNLLPGRLEPGHRGALRPAPAGDATLPGGAHAVSVLVVALVVVWGSLVGVGLIVTEMVTTRALETKIVRGFVDLRTDWLTSLAVVVGRLGSTIGVTIGTAAGASLATAVTRRWRPGVFLAVAVVGETAIFLGTAAVVDRTRPVVQHLSGDLPPTASFPSGHVAAAAALHGGIGLLLLAWSRRNWLRAVGVAWAVSVPVAVALSRLYRGVHFPSDVLASGVFAAVWLAVCWKVLAPEPDDDSGDASAKGRAPPHDAGTRREDAVAEPW